MTTPIVSVVGWHNAGKTAFLERLIVELKRRGLRVATIKHTRGQFELDRPGTDTWRYAEAGSDVIAISGRRRVALIERVDEELSLEQVVERLPADLDLIITEGYKRARTPKIEVIGTGSREGRIAPAGELLALVTQEGTGGENEQGVPCFAPGDAAGVADLLVARGLIC